MGFAFTSGAPVSPPPRPLSTQPNPKSRRGCSREEAAVVRGGDGRVDVSVSAGGVATNVGYVLFPARWGAGYATEAVRAVVAHLEGCGVRELRATVTVGNEASCRVLERCGFRRTGVLRGNDTIRGVMVDDVAFVRGG